MSSVPKSSYYQVGGSLAGDAPNYVKRQADDDLYQGLKLGEFCYVLNSRQMGKSSLQVRTIQRLKAEGVACAAIDISGIGNRGVTPEQWYAGLLRTLENHFNLSDAVNVRTWWRERDFLAPAQRLSEFIETILLTQITTPIAIFIDEIDSILALDFPADDFLALIRACYNKRPTNPEYNRLTWALLGVASPADLSQDKGNIGSTPFNIGLAIELTGFTEKEAYPLAAGFAEVAKHPEAVLQEVLAWTGGQPFLTQKLCKLLLETLPVSPTSTIQDPQAWVKQVVYSRILENWEAQDVPEHLITIRDRMLREDPRIIRRLGLYQQILEQGKVVADASSEEMELRLSGLAVKQGNFLRISNKIYQEIFNPNWVIFNLEKLPPYADQLKVWLKSQGQNIEALLSGEELASALSWAAGRSLRNEDFQFLTASQQGVLMSQKQALVFAKSETETAWNNAKTAKTEAALAKQKAQRWMSIGSTVFAVSLVAAISFSTVSYQRFQLAQTSIEIEQNGTDALLLALSANSENSQALLEALPKAISAGYQLQKLVKNQRRLEQYPATRPVLALQVILDKLNEKPEFKNQIVPQRKVMISAHKGAVTSLSFSPDGQGLVTAGVDGWVKRWNLSGQNVLQWQATSNAINTVDYSPNGQYLATAGRDGTLKIWTTSGQKIAEWKGAKNSVNSVSFSPDGRFLATAGIDDPAKIWNLSNLPKLSPSATTLPGHSGLVTSVNFSPNGKLIVSLDGNSTVRLWTTAGKLQTQLPIQAISVSFSPSQQPKNFATMTLNGKIGLWDLSKKQLVREFETLHLDARLISFSPDGERLATVGINNAVKLWNLAGRQVAEFEFDDPIVNIAWSQDGKRLAVAGSGGKVWLKPVEGLAELLQQSCEFSKHRPHYETRVSSCALIHSDR